MNNHHKRKLSARLSETFRKASLMLAVFSLSTSVFASTNTSLDHIVDVIYTDPDLAAKTSAQDIADGAQVATEMNMILVEAIKATGAADLGVITPACLKDVKNYIREYHQQRWFELYGEEIIRKKRKKITILSESGIHLIQNDGATTEWFGVNALKDVAYPIYSIYIPGDENLDRFKKNTFRRQYLSRRKVVLDTASERLNQLLTANDMAYLHSGIERQFAETGTGFDQFLDIILNDTNLQGGRVSASMIYEGMESAGKLNTILVEAIKDTGAVDDGIITPGSLLDINDYIATNYKAQWVEIHGSEDTDNGLHAVVDAGSSSQLLGYDALSRVMDSIYHLGYGFFKSRIRNEAGIPLGNVHVTLLAYWVDHILTDEDKANLHSGAAPLINTYTGSGLDRIIEIIKYDQPIYVTTNRSTLLAAIEAAYKMNMILLYSVEQLGIGDDLKISYGELKQLANYVYDNFGGEWKNLARKVQPLIGKPGLQHSSLPNAGRLNALVGRVYQIGYGVHSRGRKLGKEFNSGLARIADVAKHLTMWLYQDDIGTPFIRYTQPRKRYGWVTVNYGDTFKEFQPLSEEEVQQKISDYIASLQP